MPAKTKASWRDHEWAHTLWSVALYFLLQAILFITMRFGVRSVLEQTTRSYEYTVANAPKGYAFDMLSNESLFEPSVMNRTDTNISSPTYGYWIPPPEWRDRCIETCGMPMVTCSYFLYQEFPAFMTFFHVFMPIVAFINQLLRCFLALEVFGRCAMCLKTAYKANNLKSALTPWGMERNPQLSQVCFLRGMWTSYAFTFSLGFLVLNYYTIYNSQGLGVLNSVGTGSLYYGATFNEHPLSTPAEIVEAGGTPWPIIAWWVTLLGQSNADCTFIAYPLNWFREGNPGITMTAISGFMTGRGFFMNILIEYTQYFMWWTFRIGVGNAISMPNRAKHKKPGRVCNYPEACSVAEWRLTCDDEVTWSLSHFLMLVICSWFFFGTAAFFDVLEPAYVALGKDGYIFMLNELHAANILYTFHFLFGFVVFRFYVMRPMRLRFEENASLMSADLFNAKIKKLRGNEWAVTWFPFYCIFLLVIMVPYGMAMQVYGVKEQTSWPSPMTFVFNRPGAATNMLATPLHALLCVTTLAPLSIYFFNIRFRLFEK